MRVSMWSMRTSVLVWKCVSVYLWIGVTVCASVYVLVHVQCGEKGGSQTSSGANKEAGVCFRMGHLDGIRRAWQIGSDTGYSRGPWRETYRHSLQWKRSFEALLQQKRMNASAFQCVFADYYFFLYYTTHLWQRIVLHFAGEPLEVNKWQTSENQDQTLHQILVVSLYLKDLITQCCSEKNQSCANHEWHQRSMVVLKKYFDILGDTFF